MKYVYRAKLSRVVDGDTVWLDVDVGFYLTARIEFRLLGLNAPEMHEGTIASKKKGEEAKQFLTSLITGVDLEIETSKADKYGRFLARIYVVGDDGGNERSGGKLDVNQELLAKGHAVPYDGGKR